MNWGRGEEAEANVIEKIRALWEADLSEFEASQVVNMASSKTQPQKGGWGRGSPA